MFPRAKAFLPAVNASSLSAEEKQRVEQMAGMTIERRETGGNGKVGEEEKEKGEKEGGKLAPSKPVAQKAPSSPNPKQDGSRW